MMRVQIFGPDAELGHQTAPTTGSMFWMVFLCLVLLGQDFHGRKFYPITFHVKNHLKAPQKSLQEFKRVAIDGEKPHKSSMVRTKHVLEI